ncbi:hypothetical protein D3C78_730980 [compost metagenome]
MIAAGDEQVELLALLRGAVVGDEVHLALRTLAVQLDVHLADQVLAGIALRQEALGEVDELPCPAGEQAAVDPAVLVEGLTLQFRQQAVLATHVVVERLLDIAARGQIGQLGAQAVELLQSALVHEASSCGQDREGSEAFPIHPVLLPVWVRTQRTPLLVRLLAW